MNLARKTVSYGNKDFNFRNNPDSNQNLIVEHKSKEKICNHVGTLPTRFIPLKSGYMNTQ